MKILLSNGKELSVEDSSLTDDDVLCTKSTAIIKEDDVRLQKVWHLIFQRPTEKFGDRAYTDLELVKEIVLHNAPTENEIIYHMYENGIYPYNGIVDVLEAYELVTEDD